MRRYRFVQYDVFTGTSFGGNQLAVFPNASGLSDGEMQAIAKEMNYSESTFVLPASDMKALRRVRIFTPAAELPFAGHPVVGTTFALAHETIIRTTDPSPVHLELGVGTLSVDLLFEDRQLCFVWMHQPIPIFSDWSGEKERLAAALGLGLDDFAPDLPIERGSAGVPFLYIPVRSLEAIGRARPGADLLAALEDPSNQLCACLFTVAGLPEGVSAHVRMFAPAMGIAEDAATGSAAGPLGVYLLKHGLAKPDEHGIAGARIEQGVEMGRPSRLEVALTVDGAQAIQDVRVGGEAVLVAEGELLLPDA
jgi:trans-2,3-dihydro-3-hydroxyanthranilate isomerase